MAAVTFHYAARSDVGLVRANNQDSGYAGPQLLVLADGMGGAAGGDIASSVTVAHLAPLDGDAAGSEELLELLHEAVFATQADLAEFVRSQPELAGLGTTCIAVLRSGNRAAMIHIGDSRAYVMRDGRMQQLTQDHTFVQHLVDTGQITAEEAETHPQRSVILRAIGSEIDPELDESLRELRIGERWLLCSDGVSSFVSAETIAETLRDHDDPGDCADELVNLALRAGGGDNITAVVADVVDPRSAPDSVPQIVGAAATDRNRPTRGGGGAAARAAAILTPSSPDDPEPESQEAPRRRGLRTFLWSLVTLAVIAGALVVGYRWTQDQYYIGEDSGYVALYQGIPQEIGPLSFSQVVERSQVRVDDLPAFQQRAISDGIIARDQDEANEILTELAVEVAVNNLSNQLDQIEEQASQDATPSPSPTEGATPTDGSPPIPSPTGSTRAPDGETATATSGQAS